MNNQLVEIKTEKKLKDMLNGIIWAVKLQFSISPVQYIVYTLTRITDAVSPILNAYFGALVINKVVELINNNSQALTNEIVIILVIAAITNIIIGSLNHVFSFVELNMNHRWHWKAGAKLIQRYAELDFEHIENASFKILSQKVTDNMGWSVMFLTYKVADLVGVAVAFISIISIILLMNPILILFVTIPVIFTYIINDKFGKSMYAFWDDKGETKVEIWKASSALEQVDVVREAKIYGFAGYIVDTFSKAHEVFVNSQYKVMSRKAFWHSVVTLLNNALYIFIQIWLVLEVLASKFAIGDYTFYLTSIGGLQGKLFDMEYLINTIREQSRYADDARMFFEIKQNIVSNSNAIKVKNIAPSIEFKNVSFKYQSQENYVLKDVSFKINAGERIALVGQNGAGKTTIIKLLARFYDVTEGEILINGVNIKELDLETYYELWGCLFQSFAKLWLSPKENIGIGNLADIDNLELIKEAAKRASASEFIEKLSKGYDTKLTTDLEGGVELSGGQWQKIGIARSIFANPKFIVLDEPTSALDALAEIEVFNQIEELAKDTTVLIVSHRFATVRQANRILVLQDGKVTESGSHEDLMNLNGIYSEMFNAQAQGYN